MSKSPAYDSQRQELYRMEKEGLFGLNRSRLTRPEHRKLMKLACDKFGVPYPKLVYKASEEWAGLYINDPPTIMMSTTYRSGLSAMTLLHELAHYFVTCSDPEDHLDPHGPEFVGTYGDLMECMGFLPFGSWALLTKQYKIKCLDTGRLDPKALLVVIKKRAAEAAPKVSPKRNR